MIVVTRLRVPVEDSAAADEMRVGLQRARAILAEKPGFLGGEVGRNVDDPGLWVLSTRWENVGSYRRALSSYESKMFIHPLMIHALDEPSAFESADPGEMLNQSIPRLTPG